jgi:5-methylcytosine-specific restriction endonuclease McrA
MAQRYPTAPAVESMEVTQQGPNPYTHSYRKERERILTPDAVCYLCGQPPTPIDPLEADHVIALSMGGVHKGNLRPARRSCNRRKGGANRLRG